MRRIETIALVIIAAFLALAAPARGQEKQEPPKAASEKQEQGQKAPREQIARKVIPLKYADANAVATLLRNFDIALAQDRRMRVITITGRASAVEAAEEAINKLDVPPPPVKNIDVTGYFVLASRQPFQVAELPSEMHDVVTQLKSVLSYQNFQLLSTAFLRTRDGGQAGVSGTARAGSSMVNFSLRFNEANIISEGKTRTIRIGGLQFVAEQPPGNTTGPGADKAPSSNAVINTNIDVVEGQKVVVGRTALNFPDNALILVLTAKVID